MNDSKTPAYIRRLPSYLTYLRQLKKTGAPTVSATAIATAFGLGDVQVRKDLAAVSGAGKPKIGYVTDDLIKTIEKYLGYDSLNEAVIVGTGSLGKAILGYAGFESYGLNVTAGFDSDESKLGSVNGKPVYGIQQLEQYCKGRDIQLGIIAVPAEKAQSVCDLMIKSGIHGILNFAPVHLKTAPNITVQNENLAASLAVLANKLKEQKE